MVLPSVPLSREALLRATCDGEGLITFLTDDGPEHFACLGCRHCTPGAMPITTSSPHARMAQLLKALRAAESREALSALWAANQDIWTDWCTKVGTARQELLGSMTR
jgi:hypothetical protein